MSDFDYKAAGVTAWAVISRILVVALYCLILGLQYGYKFLKFIIPILITAYKSIREEYSTQIETVSTEVQSQLSAAATAISATIESTVSEPAKFYLQDTGNVLQAGLDSLVGDFPFIPEVNILPASVSSDTKS